MGHLEAAAAAAGIEAISALPMGTGRVGPNALLCSLNVHLQSLVSSPVARETSRSFEVPTELAARAGLDLDRTSLATQRLSALVRLSSFGYSGTIAHGLFGLAVSTRGDARTESEVQCADLVAVSLVRASLYTIVSMAPFNLGLVTQNIVHADEPTSSCEGHLASRA